MTDKPEGDIYAQLAAKDAKLTRAHYVKMNTADILDIAQSMGRTDFDPETAKALAADWTKSKMDDNNRRKSGKQQDTPFKEWATARINKRPSIVGLGGAEVQDMDKAEVFKAFGPEKNRTSLTRLVQRHGLPLVNAAAKSGGLVDAFDTRSEYRSAGYTARAGAVEQKTKPDVSGEINPFAPGPHFNLTAQSRLWVSDPTRAKKLMEKAGVTHIGMTQKQIRGGR